MNINKIIKSIYQRKEKFFVILTDSDALSSSLCDFITMKIRQQYVEVPTYIIGKEAALTLVDTYNIKEFPTVLVFNHQKIINKVAGFKAACMY